MTGTAAGGDADIASAAALFADPTRVRVLLALSDGRALPASVLAAEAGVSNQAASHQLGRLSDAGLLAVERSGRHRYYRLSGDAVGPVLESLAALAPTAPVRSLRESTRAAALRLARSCYDHLAGRLGVAVTQALLDRGALLATDGERTTSRRPGDGLSTRPATHPYTLGQHAAEVLEPLGIPADRLAARSSRPLLRICVDWSEQRHHLAGRLGAEVLTGMREAQWLRRSAVHRALRITDTGRAALREHLGIDTDALRTPS